MGGVLAFVARRLAPEFSGGTVFFGRAEFSSGTVNFGRAEFSSGTVNFGGAKFSGGTVSFDGAKWPEGVRVPDCWMADSGSGRLKRISELSEITAHYL